MKASSHPVKREFRAPGQLAPAYTRACAHALVAIAVTVGAFSWPGALAQDDGTPSGLSLSRSLDPIDLENEIALVAGEGLVGYRSLADFSTMGLEAPQRLVEEMRMEATMRRAVQARKVEVREELPPVDDSGTSVPASVRLPRRAQTSDEAAIEGMVELACDELLTGNFAAVDKFLGPGFRVNGLTFDEALKAGTARLGEGRIVDIAFPSYVVLLTGDEGFIFFAAKITIVRTGPSRTRTLSGRVALQREGEAWLAVSAEVQ